MSIGFGLFTCPEGDVEVVDRSGNVNCEKIGGICGNNNGILYAYSADGLCAETTECEQSGFVYGQTRYSCVETGSICVPGGGQIGEEDPELGRVYRYSPEGVCVKTQECTLPYEYTGENSGLCMICPNGTRMDGAGRCSICISGNRMKYNRDAGACVTPGDECEVNGNIMDGIGRGFEYDANGFCNVNAAGKCYYEDQVYSPEHLTCVSTGQDCGVDNPSGRKKKYSAAGYVKQPTSARKVEMMFTAGS